MCNGCGEELTSENTCACEGCFCEQAECEHPRTGHHSQCHPQKVGDEA